MTDDMGLVQRDVGVLQGEMRGVKDSMSRIEGKVEDGFSDLTVQIQSLRDDRSFARGIGYVMTGAIAAFISTCAVVLSKFLK